MVYELTWMFITDRNNIGKQTLTAAFINIACIVVASYGIHHVWNERYNSEIRSRVDLDQLNVAIHWLIWLRFFFICIWALFCFCLTIAFICRSNDPNL